MSEKYDRAKSEQTKKAKIRNRVYDVRMKANIIKQSWWVALDKFASCIVGYGK